MWNFHRGISFHELLFKVKRAWLPKRKRRKKNVDDISGGIYIPYYLRFAVRF